MITAAKQAPKPAIILASKPRGAAEDELADAEGPEPLADADAGVPTADPIDPLALPLAVAPGAVVDAMAA